MPVCYGVQGDGTTKKAISPPYWSLARMFAEQAPDEILEGKHFRAAQRATGSVHVGDGVDPLPVIALGEPDNIHGRTTAFHLPGEKAQELSCRDALFLAEPVRPEFVRSANAARGVEAVDYDFVGGEDKAVGPVVQGTDRLVADREALAGVRREGEFPCSGGLAAAQRGCRHGGEDRGVHEIRDSGSGIIQTRDQPQQDNEPLGLSRPGF